MKRSNIATFFTAAALSTVAGAAFSHVVLAEKSATVGSNYKAAFKVGHGCDGSPTTAISVEIPAGFTAAQPVPKVGWNLSAQPSVISWKAASKADALADGKKDEFVVNGKLTAPVGPLWFKVLQTCESGSINWSQVPAAGTLTDGIKSPAALLEVTAVGAPSVQVSDAWVRATVPGQQGSGGFMKLTSKTDARLVSITSPAAGVAEVHEMKMEGDVMRMRALDGGIELPAGKTVELRSGGFHLMLMDLKQTMAAGSKVPVTLTFRDGKDGKGVERKVEMALPVAVASPFGSGAADKADAHDHSAHKP
ncbi:MAG: copper chaperone PCu(A)C [Comamonadaceae bacterium]|nr:MAG: copper chaperone PCu(A)C [Comamonadaceae bacterium]